MQTKFLKIGSLALLQIVILGNMQIVPANALYGLSLPCLFLLAVVCFFIPCVLMVAELATTHPQTGGAYIWCEHAFGAKAGFVTVTLLWISNLLWYPSIFSLIAANFAYLFDPALAQNKTFVMTFSLILFWTFTALNCAGVRLSSKVSIWCSVIGIIMPMLLIIFCGFFWWADWQTSRHVHTNDAFVSRFITHTKSWLLNFNCHEHVWRRIDRRACRKRRQS